MKRLATMLGLLATLALPVLGLPETGAAYSPIGVQKLLVVLIERPHTGCPADTAGVPTCPRHTAAEWQTILQRDLNNWYGTETYRQTSWDVHVLADPDTTDGWWPAPHTEAQYANQNFYVGTPSLGRDAAETIPAMAVRRGVLTLSEITSTHRLVMMDNFHKRQGQTNGDNIPLSYVVTPYPGRRGMSRVFSTTVTVAPEDYSDADGISLLRHELGHQLGEPDLYSLSSDGLTPPCPWLAPGSPAETHTGQGTDCVGPWDHMGLDWWGYPGLGAFTKLFVPWIDAAGPAVQLIPPSFSGTINVDPIEQPASGKLVLEIPQDYNAAQTQRASGMPGPYTGFLIECRRLLGDDTGIPAEGALVSYIDPSRGDHLQVVARGSSSQTVDTAILSTVGARYTNTTAHVDVQYEGTTPTDGCRVGVSVSRPRYSTALPWVNRFALNRVDAPGFGGARSFSSFVGAGVMVNGPASGPATTAGLLGHATAVRPIVKGQQATIRFSYLNGGNLVARGAVATIHVLEPYAVSACGPQPVGRLIARMKLPPLAPNVLATQQVTFVPHTNGPIGVTVDVANSSTAGSASTGSELAAVAFATSHTGAGGVLSASRTTIRVTSSASCKQAMRVYLNPLAMPNGWTVTASGTGALLAPGQSLPLTLVAQPSAKTAAQTIDLPVAVQSVPDDPSLPTTSTDVPVLIGGFDLLARIQPSTGRTPSFVAAGPPPLPKLPAYPPSLPPLQPSTLNLICPKDSADGTMVTTAGTLQPAETGAAVTLTYSDAQSSAIVVHTVFTDGDGLFADTFTPPTGVWTVMASWLGDGVYTGSKATACGFTIENAFVPSGVGSLASLNVLFGLLADDLGITAPGLSKQAASRHSATKLGHLSRKAKS